MPTLNWRRPGSISNHGIKLCLPHAEQANILDTWEGKKLDSFDRSFRATLALNADEQLLMSQGRLPISQHFLLTFHPGNFVGLC